MFKKTNLQFSHLLVIKLIYLNSNHNYHIKSRRLIYSWQHKCSHYWDRILLQNQTSFQSQTQQH